MIVAVLDCLELLDLFAGRFLAVEVVCRPNRIADVGTANGPSAN